MLIYHPSSAAHRSCALSFGRQYGTTGPEFVKSVGKRAILRQTAKTTARFDPEKYPEKKQVQGRTVVQGSRQTQQRTQNRPPWGERQ